MSEELSILLRAKLDMENSIRDIDRQVKNLEKELSSVNLSININGIKQSFSKMIEQFSKEQKKLAVGGTVDTKSLSKYEEGLNRLIHLYKTQEIASDKFLTSMQRMMYNVNSETGETTKKIEYQNLAWKKQEELISLVSKAEKERVSNSKQESSIMLKMAQEETKQRKERLELEKLLNQITSKKAKVDGVTVRNDRYSKSDYENLIYSYDRISNSLKENKITMAEARVELSKLDAEARSFSNSAAKLSDSTSSFSDQLKKFTAFYGLYDVFNQIKEVTKDMVTSINGMNKAMTDIQIVTGMSSVEVEGLRKSYNELGKELGATTNDMLLGATEWYRQGKTIAETQELITASIIGAKLSGTESAQMTEYLTATLNSYQMEASKAISVVDKMVAVDNAGATSVEELSVALQRTSSSARMAGVDLDTLLGYIGTVSSVTRRSAENVGESFKTIFARYQNIKLGKFNEDGIVTSDVIKTLENVGVKIKENETTFRDFGEVVEEIAGKWTTYNDAEKSAIAQSMAGVHQRESFLVLMENYVMATDLSTESIESNGLALDRYDTYLSSTEALLSKFKATAESVFIETLSSDTINNILRLSTATLELVSNIGGLVPILISVSAAIAMIKAEAIGSFMVSGAKAVGGLVASMAKVKFIFIDALTAIKAYNAGIITTTTITQACVPVIGALTIAVSGIVMAINAYEKAQEEAIQRAKEYNANIDSQRDGINQLLVKYEELSSEQNINTQQRKELEQIQADIVTMLGHEASSIDLVNKSYQENKDIIDGVIESRTRLYDINNEKIIDDANRKLKELAKDGVVISGYSLGDFSKIEKQIEEEFGNIIDKVNSGNSNVFRLRFETDDFEQLQDAVYRVKQLMEQQGLVGTKTYSDWLDYCGQISSAYNDINSKLDEQHKAQARVAVENIKASNGITDVTKATKEQYELMKQDIGKQYMSGVSMTTENAKKLTYAMDALNTMFPQFADTVNDSTNSTNEQAEAFDNLKSKFDSITSNVDMLNSTLESLNNNHQLSAKEISGLADKYPQLLQYLGDEEALRQKLQDEIRNTVTEQEKAYTDMIMSSEGYYDSLIQQDTDSRNELLSILDTYNNSVDEAHRKQLEDFTSLENMKIETTAQIISELGKLWQQYFSVLSTSFGKHGFDATANVKYDMTPEQWDKMSGLQKSQYQKAIDEAQNSPIAKMYDDMYKQFEEASKTFAKFEPKYSGSNTSKIPSSSKGGSKSGSGSKKDNLSKQIKDELDKAIKEIQSARNKLDSEIEMLNSKLTLAKTRGDDTEIERLLNQMSPLLSKRKQLTAEENVQLELLKKKYNQEESIATIESEMSKNSLAWWSDENNIIEHNIALLQKRIEIMTKPLEKIEQSIDGMTTKLELLQLTQEDNISLQIKMMYDLNEEYLKQQQCLEDVLEDLYSQRDSVSETSSMYEELTNKIMEFEKQQANAIKSEIDLRKEAIDLLSEEMSMQLENAIYGKQGKESWEDDNDDRIDSLNKELDIIKQQSDAKKKAEEAEKRALEMQQLREKLANLQKQKTQQEYKKQSDGSWQWEYVADKEAIAQVEKEIKDRELEDERRLEEEKQYLREQSIRDEIARCQKEKEIKAQAFELAKSDLIAHLTTTKDLWNVNGQEVVGIVDGSLTTVSEKFDVTMSDIIRNVEGKLDEMSGIFDGFLGLIGSMGGSGGSSGGSIYTATGGSGKVYFQYPDGSIEVQRKDGSSSTVYPTSPNYGSTVNAMEKDKVIKKYSKGGLIDYDGIAMVHGGKEPEMVLNPPQTKAMMLMAENLPRFSQIMDTVMRPNISMAEPLRTPAMTTNSPNKYVHIENMNLPNVQKPEDFPTNFEREMARYFGGISQKAKLKPTVI